MKGISTTKFNIILMHIMVSLTAAKVFLSRHVRINDKQKWKTNEFMYFCIFQRDITALLSKATGRIQELRY